MVFTVDFKQKVFDTLQFNPYLMSCMDALESNNSNMFRIYLDMALDEVKEAAQPRILQDEGERLLWNGIVTQYNAILTLQTEFMEAYMEELDRSKSKVHE